MYTEPVIVWQYCRRAPQRTRMVRYECTGGMWFEDESSTSMGSSFADRDRKQSPFVRTCDLMIDR